VVAVDDDVVGFLKQWERQLNETWLELEFEV
jgi:hypothetical protein